MAFRSAAGDAFALRTASDGRVVAATAGGVWFDADALRVVALELRDPAAAAGSASFTSLGLLRNGCRVPATPAAWGGAGTGRRAVPIAVLRFA